MEHIKNYFEKTKSYSIWRFILEMTVLAFILKIIFIIIGLPIVGALGLNTESDLSFEKSFLDYQLWMTAGLIILFAAFETITSQMFILWLAKKISKDTAFRLLLSAIIFALLHIEPMMIFGVFPIGLILGWAYLIYREKSLWSALWVTTTIHVLHNLFALWLVSLAG